MTRATVSVGPPAEKDTIMRTGLDGYLSSALAPAPTAAHARRAPARAASHRSCLPMTSLLDFMTHGNIWSNRTTTGIMTLAVSPLLNPDARRLDDFCPISGFRCGYTRHNPRAC